MRFVQIHRHRLFALNCPDMCKRLRIGIAALSGGPVRRFPRIYIGYGRTGLPDLFANRSITLADCHCELRRQQKCRIMEAWTDRLIQGIKGNEPALRSIISPSLSVSRALSLQRKVEKETVVGPWTREGTCLLDAPSRKKMITENNHMRISHRWPSTQQAGSSSVHPTTTSHQATLLPLSP